MAGWEGVCARQGCHARICLSAEANERARRTHESFYCTSGHRNYFSDKTEHEKKIDQLRKRLESVEYMRDYWHRKHDELARACPWTLCGFVGSDPKGMRQHMRKAHGMPTLGFVRGQLAEEAS